MVSQGGFTPSSTSYDSQNESHIIVRMKIIRFRELTYTPASHETPKNPGVWKKVLLKRDDLINGRVQMINWAKIPVGKAFAKHYHEDMEEVFIMLSGKAEVTINNEKAVIGIGDVVLVPIGKTHTMRNIGETDAGYIVLGIALGKGGKTINV